MIVARMFRDDEQQLLVVLEPANLEKMQMGAPLKLDLSQFVLEPNKKMSLVIVYTPDVVWVTEQMGNVLGMGNTFETEKLIQVLEASLTREPVYCGLGVMENTVMVGMKLGVYQAENGKWGLIGEVMYGDEVEQVTGPAHYPTEEAALVYQARFREEVLAQLRELPGVEKITVNGKGMEK